MELRKRFYTPRSCTSKIVKLALLTFLMIQGCKSDQASKKSNSKNISPALVSKSISSKKNASRNILDLRKYVFADGKVETRFKLDQVNVATTKEEILWMVLGLQGQESLNFSSLTLEELDILENYLISIQKNMSISDEEEFLYLSSLVLKKDLKQDLDKIEPIKPDSLENIQRISFLLAALVNDIKDKKLSIEQQENISSKLLNISKDYLYKGKDDLGVHAEGNLICWDMMNLANLLRLDKNNEVFKTRFINDVNIYDYYLKKFRVSFKNLKDFIPCLAALSQVMGPENFLKSKYLSLALDQYLLPQIDKRKVGSKVDIRRVGHDRGGRLFLDSPMGPYYNEISIPTNSWLIYIFASLLEDKKGLYEKLEDELFTDKEQYNPNYDRSAKNKRIIKQFMTGRLVKEPKKRAKKKKPLSSHTEQQKQPKK